MQELRQKEKLVIMFLFYLKFWCFVHYGFFCINIDYFKSYSKILLILIDKLLAPP